MTFPVSRALASAARTADLSIFDIDALLEAAGGDCPTAVLAIDFSRSRGRHVTPATVNDPAFILALPELEAAAERAARESEERQAAAAAEAERQAGEDSTPTEEWRERASLLEAQESDLEADVANALAAAETAKRKLRETSSELARVRGILTARRQASAASAVVASRREAVGGAGQLALELGASAHDVEQVLLALDGDHDRASTWIHAATAAGLPLVPVDVLSPALVER